MMLTKNAFRSVIKKILFSIYYIVAVVRLPVVYNREHENGQLKYLSDEDFKIWKTSFINLLRVHYKSNYGYGQRELLTAFAKANIVVKRMNAIEDNENPTVVLCVKNDLRRIQMLVSHYRKYGVSHFAFLDNGSSDGTLEWILEQEDIDVFTTEDKYSSLTKEAWINRVISYYGFNHWFIITDSDELVSYIGIETHSFKDIIKFASDNGYQCLEALTLDMYSEIPLYAELKEKGIEEEYCWMDSDSYIVQPKRVGNQIVEWLTGGPRMRVMNVSTSLMKFPLVYFSPGIVSANAHFIYPYTLIGTVPCCLAIRHYKFLSEDKKEYKRRAKSNSGFAHDGGYYRNYINNVNRTNNKNEFMYEGSIKYTDSASLKHITMIKEVF